MMIILSEAWIWAQLQVQMKKQVSKLSDQYNWFHWALALGSSDGYLKKKPPSACPYLFIKNPVPLMLKYLILLRMKLHYHQWDGTVTAFFEAASYLLETHTTDGTISKKCRYHAVQASFKQTNN